MQAGSLSDLRVLHVIPSISTADGGPTRAVMLMERTLRELGIDVTTLTTDHDIGVQAMRWQAVASGGRVYVRKWLDWYKVAPGAIPYLVRHIRDFDVVHIHALFSFTSTIAAWAAHAGGVPYVVRPLGTLSPYGLSQRRRRLKRLSMAAIEGPILRRAAAVHCTSRMEEAEVSDLGIPLRSEVIPLGVEAIAVGAKPAAGHRERASPRRRILFLSRLDPKKNVESLIDAIASSERLRSETSLVIAGDGERGYVETLKSRADSVGIGRIVTWCGHVEGDRKASLLGGAHVFVLPSVSENFGIAAVEAMLAGVPCVLAPGVAIAEDVHAAGAGLVAGPDPGELATAIVRLLDDHSLHASMSRQAQAHAMKTYSAAAMGRRLVELYTSVSYAKGKPGQ